jgi:hypothetical protein
VAQRAIIASGASSRDAAVRHRRRKELHTMDSDVSRHADQGMHHHPYRRLAAMLVLSFLVMWALTYAMVDRFDNVLPSLNKAYMAGMMTTAMLAIELALMGAMYPRRGLNLALVGIGILATAALWGAVRSQAGMVDRQFLRAMIPHHAGAVLMCQQAPLRRADVRALCERIVASQNAEIAEMKAMLSTSPQRAAIVE